jgi:hypothetical protein
MITLLVLFRYQIIFFFAWFDTLTIYVVKGNRAIKRALFIALFTFLWQLAQLPLRFRE